MIVSFCRTIFQTPLSDQVKHTDKHLFISSVRHNKDTTNEVNRERTNVWKYNSITYSVIFVYET